jgi:hypothetical protein
VIFSRADIARDLGLNPETVRNPIARFRKHGPDSIAPDDSRRGPRRRTPRR